MTQMNFLTEITRLQSPAPLRTVERIAPRRDRRRKEREVKQKLKP
ncbi:hypothetical protein [Trichocoleus sp. FACHB-591]|nr:hypothetical protein [Trichocoleus sp. FACHB-591]